MIRAALLNGSAAGAELAWSRGLHYGDGIFRTCLIYASQCIDLQDHIRKACADAAGLGLEPPPADLLASEAAALAQGCARGVLKLVLARAGTQRGYRGESRAADRLLLRDAAPMLPSSAWERGIRAVRSDFRLATQPALAGIKHLNRLEQVLASRSWPAEADELIVGDAAGRPVSGTRSNLFWVGGNALRTPALDECGVAGVMRDRVLGAAPALGLAVEIAAGSWTELEEASEAFVTNSVVGVWPLASLGARRWDAPGPVTRRLMDHLRHPRLAAP